MSPRRAWLDRSGRLARVAFDTLVPRRCVVCGQGTPSGMPPVCALCWHRLPRIPDPHCPRCGEPRSWPLLKAPGHPTSHPECPACDGWEALHAAAAPFAFEGSASRVVKALKYGRWRELARPMGHAMVPSAKGLVRESEPLLVPVALSAARERERGFNQAELLAGALASKTGWQWRPLLLRRPGGRRQARLARHARSENVRELFSASQVVDPSVDILVVDDVFTTGATARACAQTLREAGFGRVSVVTFARTLRPLEVTDDAGPAGARS